MEVTGAANKAIEFIPALIVWIRENVLLRLLDLFNFPQESSFPILAAVIAFVGGYYYFKQMIAVSIFSRASTFLRFILLVLLIFLVITRVS